MSNFWKQVVALIVAGALMGSVFAQGTGQGKAGQGKSGQNKSSQSGKMKQGQDARRGRGMDDVFAKLNLSKEQKTKIDKLRKDNTAKTKAIREGKGDAESKRTKLRAERTKFMESVNKVLTAAQKKKLDEMFKQMRDRRPGPSSKQKQGTTTGKTKK